MCICVCACVCACVCVPALSISVCGPKLLLIGKCDNGARGNIDLQSDALQYNSSSFQVCVCKPVFECVCVCFCVLISRTPFRAEWRISLHLFGCSLTDIRYISAISSPRRLPFPVPFASSSCFSSSSPLLILEQPESLGSSGQLSAVLFGFWFSSSSLRQLLTHMFICFLQSWFFICSLYVLKLWRMPAVMWFMPL